MLLRRRRARLAVTAAIVAVVAGGSAAAAVLLSRGHHAAPVSLRSDATPIRSHPAVRQSPTARPAPSTADGGQISAAASLAGNPLGQPVVILLDKYFTAINRHDYQAYRSLLTLQQLQGLTVGAFDSGYRSTRDSAETLVSVLAGSGTVATVTFTSHQNPADSYNHLQSCTRWRISLFLQPNGSSYLIGKPQPGYHASAVACP